MGRVCSGSIPSYCLAAKKGGTILLGMFGEHDMLLLIHNMGQGCRYCTLWADGFTGFCHIWNRPCQ